MKKFIMAIVLVFGLIGTLVFSQNSSLDNKSRQGSLVESRQNSLRNLFLSFRKKAAREGKLSQDQFRSSVSDKESDYNNYKTLWHFFVESEIYHCFNSTWSFRTCFYKDRTKYRCLNEKECQNFGEYIEFIKGITINYPKSHFFYDSLRLILDREKRDYNGDPVVQKHVQKILAEMDTKKHYEMQKTAKKIVEFNKEQALKEKTRRKEEELRAWLPTYCLELGFDIPGGCERAGTVIRLQKEFKDFIYTNGNIWVVDDVKVDHPKDTPFVYSRGKVSGVSRVFIKLSKDYTAFVNQCGSGEVSVECSLKVVHKGTELSNLKFKILNAADSAWVLDGFVYIKRNDKLKSLDFYQITRETNDEDLDGVNEFNKKTGSIFRLHLGTGKVEKVNLSTSSIDQIVEQYDVSQKRIYKRQ